MLAAWSSRPQRTEAITKPRKYVAIAAAKSPHDASLSPSETAPQSTDAATIPSRPTLTRILTGSDVAIAAIRGSATGALSAAAAGAAAQAEASTAVQRAAHVKPRRHRMRGCRR